MRGLRHPYLWGRDHPLVVDTLFAGVLAAVGLVGELFNDLTTEEAAEYSIREPDLRSALLTLAATVPLVLRRRYPLAVYVPVFVAANFYYTLQYSGGGPMLGLLVTLYGVAAHSPRRTAVYVLGGTIVALVTLTLLFPAEDESVLAVIAITGLLVAAWVIGDNLRVRRAYLAAVEDRAAQLEREQDAQARRAVLEERSRIARELHDIVAHSMSVMVVQAGAARRTLDRDRERAVEAIGQIETTGRDALAEMRRVVAVLRGDLDEPREPADASDASVREALDRDRLLPQPGMDQLPVLVAQCREAGLEVDLQVEGEPRPLPTGVELTVYRIVQEALTNTIRHAGPARATVQLCYDDEGIRLAVLDDGRGASVLSPTSSGVSDADVDPGDGVRSPGHGLTGMHERVALFGGSVTAGPRTGGGFAVKAEIPVPEPSPAPAPSSATEDEDDEPSRLPLGGVAGRVTGWWAS